MIKKLFASQKLEKRNEGESSNLFCMMKRGNILHKGFRFDQIFNRGCLCTQEILHQKNQ